ncbi:MAG: redoxin family protein [Alphaproteobacteria bacterium]|nr:redoxin family protein [Alphaproteobacteria bacterium]
MSKLLTALFALLLIVPAAYAAPTVGEAAPNFTGIDSNGVEHSLSDFKGKTVVLEWSNHECPFVVKHYKPGNMQKLQKQATDDGVIWLTVVSSAEGKQGHTTGDEANKVIEEVGAHSTARILDESGEIGKLYDAKTTPHMFVIDQEGILAYAGAIDSDSRFSSDSIAGATNYVTAALEDLAASREVQTPSTKPYGCSVKY